MREVSLGDLDSGTRDWLHSVTRGEQLFIDDGIEDVKHVDTPCSESAEGKRVRKQKAPKSEDLPTVTPPRPTRLAGKSLKL